MPQDIPLQAAAVLVWLANEVHPSALESFDAPELHAQPWWKLEDAVVFAVDNMDVHQGKQPWIKAGETVFGPLDIGPVYKQIMEHRASLYQPRER